MLMTTLLDWLNLRSLAG